MTIIYTDHNSVAVDAMATDHQGNDVEGHSYRVMFGVHTAFIDFQRGGVAIHGVNGMTNEALLAILIHRTKFLNAKFPCVENEVAINGMEVALEALEARTKGRMARGVEGKEVA